MKRMWIFIKINFNDGTGVNKNEFQSYLMAF